MKNLDNSTRDIIIFFTIFISVVVTVIGILNGGFKAVDDYNNGGCKYQSIASYNPSRILICELLRKRWD